MIPPFWIGALSVYLTLQVSHMFLRYADDDFMVFLITTLLSIAFSLGIYFLWGLTQ